MADATVGRVTSWCPLCRIDVGNAEHCPRCLFPQVGPEIDRWRGVVLELDEVQELLVQKSRQAEELRGESQRLRTLLRPETVPTPAPALPMSTEAAAPLRSPRSPPVGLAPPAESRLE